MIVAMHVVHGTALAILFRIVLDLSRTTIQTPSVFAYAVVYSIVLWILSPFLTRKFFETVGSFRMTRKGLTVSLLAHIIYGAFLGLLIAIFV